MFLARCVNCGVCSRDFSLGRGADKNRKHLFIRSVYSPYNKNLKEGVSFFLDFSTSCCKVVDSRSSMIFGGLGGPLPHGGPIPSRTLS